MITLADLADRIMHAGEVAHSAPDFPGDPPGSIGTQHYVSIPPDAEMLMALAEMRRPCSYAPCHPKAGAPRVDMICPECHETGSVARFPTLREPCFCAHQQRVNSPQAYTSESWIDLGGCLSCWDNNAHSQRCARCRGRNWVPIQHDAVQKVWDEMRKLSRQRFLGFARAAWLRMIADNAGNRGESALTATLAAAVLVLAEEEEKP